MNKIRVIDLLNKIANGEEVPKKIKYMGYILEWDTNHKRYEGYFDEQIWTLNDFFNVNDNLNDTVEILEEEKEIPEKLNLDKEKLRGKETPRAIDYLIESKINQVIDYLKSKGE